MEQKSEIFIWHEGREKGPFSATALTGSIRLGSIPPETPAWTRANRQWRSASELLRQLSIEQASQTPARSIPKSALDERWRDNEIIPAAKPATGGGAIPRTVLILAAITCILMIILLSRPGAPRDTSSTSTDFTDLNREESSAPAEPQENDAVSDEIKPVSRSRWALSLDEAERCVLMARSKDGSGTAFIAMDGERYHVYTNVHVASSEGLEFSDFRGNPVKVSPRGQVVGSSNHAGIEPGIDIVRFPYVGTPEFYLKFASRETIEKKPEVWTLGDSGGEKILKTLHGRVKGVGPAKIEVDCEFIQGNSGGPIVTSNGEAVGIASYMTSNQTIWAKGTEQEIRRMAWIPGGEHAWVETSAKDLAEERSLVMGCLATSRVLLIISRLKTAEDGFHMPDDPPEEIGVLLVMTGGHPLRNGVDELSKSMSTRAHHSSIPVTHREFVRFFDSCVAYQESQLEKAERVVRSSYWLNEMEPMMEAHKELLKQFRDDLERYRSSGELGGALGDS